MSEKSENRKKADSLRYWRNKVTTHTCIVCNHSFIANHKRKYCSIECNPHRAKFDRSERKCVQCNGPYIPVRADQKHCSSKCKPYRKNSANRFYNTKEWTSIRKAFISSYTKVNGIDLSNKYCIQCYIKQNRLNDMHAVDHKVSLRDGGTNDFKNLQSLCRHHHQSKSAVEGNKLRLGEVRRKGGVRSRSM